MGCDRKDLNFYYRSVMKDLRRIWKGCMEGDDDAWEELYNYGLAFDYVPPNTFRDQPEGYFRWQIAWGGPAFELRFFVGFGGEIIDIQAVYGDWYCEIKRNPTNRDWELLEEIFNYLFKETGALDQAYKEAMEE